MIKDHTSRCQGRCYPTTLSRCSKSHVSSHGHWLVHYSWYLVTCLFSIISSVHAYNIHHTSYYVSIFPQFILNNHKISDKNIFVWGVCSVWMYVCLWRQCLIPVSLYRCYVICSCPFFKIWAAFADMWTPQDSMSHLAGVSPSAKGYGYQGSWATPTNQKSQS